MAFTEHDYPY